MSPLGAPVQIAYIVDDVRRAAEQWSATHGIGPFFVFDHIQVCDVRYRDQPAVFDHSSAFAQWGPLMVELLCDHGGLFAGHTGVHHVAHFVPELEAAQRWCRDNGFPEAMHATTATGMPFVFHDATATYGHYIELYEPNSRVVGLYEMVARTAREWDGTEPIRTVTR